LVTGYAAGEEIDRSVRPRQSRHSVMPKQSWTKAVSDLDAEIRFAKTQQWYVSTAAITLIAAMYACISSCA